MNLPWFKRVGIFFVPSKILGWLILLLALAIAVDRFHAIDSHSHSASDTLINFFFNLLIIGAIYSLIAFFTSKDSNSTAE